MHGCVDELGKLTPGVLCAPVDSRLRANDGFFLLFE